MNLILIPKKLKLILLHKKRDAIEHPSFYDFIEHTFYLRRQLKKNPPN